MFAAIRPGLTEPNAHFRSFFAVLTPKYGLARQSRDGNRSRNAVGLQFFCKNRKKLQLDLTEPVKKLLFCALSIRMTYFVARIYYISAHGSTKQIEERN